MTNSDGTHQGLSQKNAGQASIHDTLFYKVFGNAKRAAAELKAILPQNLNREVDWDSLRVEPNRFVDEQLRNHFADILLSVQIRKRKTYLHLLFEHSSNPKSHELLQALRYQVRLWESEDKPANEAGVRPLTPVLTVILHHSETGWRGKCRFADYFEMGDDTAKMFGPFLVDFGVFVDDLSRLGVEELLARPVPADVQVMLFALRFGRTGGDVLKELPKIEPQLRELKEQQHGTVALKLFFLYIRQVARVSGDSCVWPCKTCSNL